MNNHGPINASREYATARPRLTAQPILSRDCKGAVRQRPESTLRPARIQPVPQPTDPTRWQRLQPVCAALAAPRLTTQSILSRDCKGAVRQRPESTLRPARIQRPVTPVFDAPSPHAATTPCLSPLKSPYVGQAFNLWADFQSAHTATAAHRAPRTKAPAQPGDTPRPTRGPQ